MSNSLLLKMVIEIVDFPSENGGSFQFAMGQFTRPGTHRPKICPSRKTKYPKNHPSINVYVSLKKGDLLSTGSSFLKKFAMWVVYHPCFSDRPISNVCIYFQLYTSIHIYIYAYILCISPWECLLINPHNIFWVINPYDTPHHFYFLFGFRPPVIPGRAVEVTFMGKTMVP